VKPYVCYNSKLNLNSKNKNFCLYDTEGEEINIENIAKETTQKIISQDKITRDTINKFIEGFRNQINVNSTQLYRLPLKLFNELIYGLNYINFDLLMKHLNFEEFVTEERKNYLIQLIKDNICRDPNYIEKLLLLITGTTRIPSIGYPRDKQLRIILSFDSKIPYEAHTCFNYLLINTNIFNDYIFSTNKKETLLFEYFTPEALKNLSSNFTIE
jgi:hypothetical protein